MGIRLRSRFRHLAWLCGLVVAISVLATNPFVESGMNDDFAYAWCAKTLAQTGHVVYNAWGLMMLGWQLLLGATFIKIFGFSFTIVRAGVFLVAIITTILLQRIFVHCGISERNAAFGTLTLMLSPLVCPLCFSYMTDVPALFALLVCLYGCLRAVESLSRRAVLGWLAFAFVSNALLGTVRQVAWLGLLVMVPSACWVLRRTRGVLIAALAMWVLGAAFIVLCLRWFEAQPYTFHEPLLHGHLPLRALVHGMLAAIFCALPVMFAFLVHAKPDWLRSRRMVVAAGLFALACFSILFMSHQPGEWLAPFGTDALSAHGVDIPMTMVGEATAVIPRAVRWFLTALTLLSGLSLLLWALPWSSAIESTETALRKRSTNVVWVLLLPLTGSYLFLIATRSLVYDRYWIPLLFMFLVGLLRMYEHKVSSVLPASCGFVLGIAAAFSVLSTHDQFATYRARLAAANELTNAGVPRTSFFAGVEYDGWTELQQQGYIDNPRMKLPQEKLKDAALVGLPWSCVPWYTSWDPAINPEYEVSQAPTPCFPLADRPPVHYTTWLPPTHRELYFIRIPDSYRGAN